MRKLPMTGALLICALCLFLFGPVPAPAQSPSDNGAATPPAGADEAIEDFADLTKNLVHLQGKIDRTANVVRDNANPDTVRAQVDQLKRMVTGLLAALSDDGQVAQLGKTAMDYARGKLAEINQDTHFTNAQKSQLLARWQRIVTQTDDAVKKLEETRVGLLVQLRALDAAQDFLGQMEEIRRARATTDAINDLQEQRRAISERLNDLLHPEGPTKNKGS